MANTDKAGNILALLKASLRAVLDETAETDPDYETIGFCEIVPGIGVVQSYAWGDEDNCGLSWVRLIQLYPALGLGRPAADYDGCGTLIGMDVEIGIGRCIPVEDPDSTDGTPPEPATLTAISLLNAKDALVVRRAVACCGLSNKNYRLGSYVPFGPQGLLGGGVWQAQVLIP